jgi:hypothetical protein
VNQQELDALPDVTPYFEQRDEVRDGVRYTVAVQPPAGEEFLWQPDDAAPLWVTDRFGVDWMIGYLRDGTLAKRKAGW